MISIEYTGHCGVCKDKDLRLIELPMWDGKEYFIECNHVNVCIHAKKDFEELKEKIKKF